ncbi:MAG: pilus assembly protein [Candidatus Eremiobacteraeota bacterium]|nr:pilus assembly protein [Candidatus Eremiobacteraeota bacterium]
MKRIVFDVASSSHAQRGTAAVEFALVLPFLLLLMFGVAELGRYSLFSLTVANAARAGAVYGAQDPTAFADGAGITDAAQQDGNTSIISTPLAVATSTPSSCWSDTSTATTAPTGTTCPNGYHFVQYISVTASGTISPLFSDKFFQLGSPTISSTVTLRVCQVCP